MSTRTELRMLLANVIMTWYEQQSIRRGMRRFIAKRATDAALEALADALTGLDEPPEGVIWFRAYQAVVLWLQGHSIKRAMWRLLAAYHKTFRGEI